jgi:hypothetical protein
MKKTLLYYLIVSLTAVLLSPNIIIWCQEKNIRLITREVKVDSSHINLTVDSKSILPSHNCEHLAYIAERHNKRLVVVDGQEGREYDQIIGLNFSTNAHHLAYLAILGEYSVVVVDGVEGKPYTIRGRVITKYGFDSEQYVLFGGGAPIFSPDGQHLAYIAQHDSGGMFICIDGQEIERRYIAFISGSRLVFDSPNSLHGLALSNSGFVRVEIEIVH